MKLAILPPADVASPILYEPPKSIPLLIINVALVQTSIIVNHPSKTVGYAVDLLTYKYAVLVVYFALLILEINLDCRGVDEPISLKLHQVETSKQ